MLCNICRRHFDFAFQDYASIKESTISELQACHAHPALLHFLQSDLHIYRASRYHGQLDACPWVSSKVVSAYLNDTARATLTDHELGIWKGSPSESRTKNLWESAEKGCHMCMRICEAVECLHYNVEVVQVESWLVLEPVTLIPLGIKIRVENDSLEVEYLRFKFLGADSTFGRQAFGHSAGKSVSDGCLDKLIACLSECSNAHTKCQMINNPDWIPSRLIDIHQLKTSGKVRLVFRGEVELSQPDRQPRYITLSHVWGSHKFLTLTASNMQELRSGFPVSRLSKSFQEAIGVTEKIGLRYIWIDSLCIVQDSEEDWRSEAGCMDEVYLNSFCTIAASLATSPDEGLFWDRRVDLSEPLDVSFTSAAGSTSFQVFQDLQFLILNNAPLYKRGWVLQESYLSPRTIHFTKFPSFECREIFECESYRTVEAELPASDSDWLHYTAKSISRVGEFSYSNWWTIVYCYSRCNFTKETDKLIALCGIAKALSSAIPGNYYAGIWAPWWLPGLLWSVDQLSSGFEMYACRPASAYIAPSWSWASVEGPIQPWSTHYKIVQALVELKSIFTTPANGDPFGQISGGEIALTGKLFEVPRFRALAEADRTSFAAYAFSLDDYDDECLDNRTFYLPLVKAPKYTLYDDLDICGLLLQLAECDDKRERVFQRVGFAVVAKVDGAIALADHRVDNWSPPPWSGDELEVVVIL